MWWILRVGVVSAAMSCAAGRTPAPNDSGGIHATVAVVSVPPVIASPGVVPGAVRAPLHSVPLIKLAPGAVQPRGWLRTQLILARDGMIGRLDELSPWCRFEGSAWADPGGRGEYGWEELPYWLRGCTSLAFVLRDRPLQEKCMRWLNAILASQRPDGYFGPEANRASMDLWPNMLALYGLRTLFEATADRQVLPFMLRYFRWVAGIPDAKLLPASWQHVRGGDQLDTIYWLYNRTGESWLLDLARRTHERTAPWEHGIASLHGVNFAQGFREPAQYYQQSRDTRHLQATIHNYEEMRRLYGQVPGGMYAADENARPGYTGPRQGTETCSFVEMMYSFEELVRITGAPVWADRCEEVALNSFPAALTPDLKGLHYLTCPNQVVLDRADKSPMIQNAGDMFSYTPYEQYRCCQHNVAFGWPYYAEHLWMATRDNGIAAVLYAPSDVTTMVGPRKPVTLRTDTEYPFGDTLRITVRSSGRVTFPLYLRIPGWCDRPSVSINGKSVRIPAAAGRWVALRREWSSGDSIVLRLPMRIGITWWTGNRNTVSVHRGPLTYSLRIAEHWRRYENAREWPAFEVWPGSPWNYGLILDKENPSKSLRVEETGTKDASGQPFAWNRSPIIIHARARRIPNWQLERNNLIQEVQPGPIRSTEPTEQVALIPMGCARLRLSAFPLVGAGPEARAWPETPPGPSASWVNPSDTVEALTDGILPASSADTRIPRFTWWDHVGTKEWVQIDFSAARTVEACEVYWFDDEPSGGRCRLPEQWSVLWLDGKEWRPVEPTTAYEAVKDRFSTVRFRPVTTTALRVEVQLRQGFSGGALELRVRP